MDVTGTSKPDSVLCFWFEECLPKHWWIKDPAFDAQVTERFLSLHQQASAGELFAWRETAQGRLAEIIILDQFSRNIFRGKAAAFASDPIALALAQEAYQQKAHEQLQGAYQQFLYMPYMHSESAVIHQQAVAIFSELKLDGTLNHELRHKAIIDQFGRYPHRNVILQRESTPEELDFLKQPGSSF